MKALLRFFLHDKWFSVRKWFLDLCAHSHWKKIEMCNAWLHLLNTGIIKMGFGFMRVLASEEKSNSLSQLENVCSLNICLQLLLFCANLFLSAFLSFFCFLWWREGRRVERLWGRLRRRLFNMSKFALERFFFVSILISRMQNGGLILVFSRLLQKVFGILLFAQ